MSGALTSKQKSFACAMGNDYPPRRVNCEVEPMEFGDAVYCERGTYDAQKDDALDENKVEKGASLRKAAKKRTS